MGNQNTLRGAIATIIGICFALLDLLILGLIAGSIGIGKEILVDNQALVADYVARDGKVPFLFAIIPLTSCLLAFYGHEVLTRREAQNFFFAAAAAAIVFAGIMAAWTGVITAFIACAGIALYTWLTQRIQAQNPP